MEFSVRPMDRESAQQVAGWHYEGPYAFYDMTSDPEDLAELLNPQSWGITYYAVADAEGILVGFFCFYPAGPTVEVGLGLRPNPTGKGLGLTFLEAGLAFARKRYAPTSFRLAVAAFNQRAIKLYRKAGFQPGRVYKQQTNGGEYDFLEMTREA